VPGGEVDNILMAYHSSVCGGQLCAKKTSRKILHAGFYRPQLFKDCHELCNACDRCQRFGGLTTRHGTPQHAMPSCEVLGVWATDFMGPFPPSSGYTYTLPAVDYHSRRVEATPTGKDDAVTVSTFLRPSIFSRFGVPRGTARDQGSHFCNKILGGLFAKFGIKRKVSTAYHPQTNGQAKSSNKAIKRILERIV